MAVDLVSRVLSYFTFFYDKQAWLTGHSADGREQELLTYVLQTAEEGNAESVLRAIDNFTCHTWLPILGEEKGSILDVAVQEFDPTVALELGTYCGYSAIRIASMMANPDSKLVSVEMNPDNCEIAREMIEYAGLASKVRVLKGTLSEVADKLKNLLDEMGAPYFDFILMDHFKDRFLPDFLLLEDREMLGRGTCIVADSKGIGESQDYLNYLKEHPENLQTEEYKCNLKFLSSLLPCKMTVSTYIADDVQSVT